MAASKRPKRPALWGRPPVSAAEPSLLKMPPSGVTLRPLSASAAEQAAAPARASGVRSGSRAGC
eukprot:2021951-Lingulodinium_polyedra.AAC.1